MQLVDLAVGSLVKDPNTTYNGDPIIWRVLEHGHTGDPSGCTTLDARDIVTLKCFDAKESNNSNSDRKKYGNNRYLYSNILQWLNSDAAAGQWYTAQHSADAPPNSSNVWQSSGTAINPYNTEAGFLTNFSSDLKEALQTVSKTTVKASVDGGGSEAVSSKVFLLSTTEVGTESKGEGSVYSYYSSGGNDGRKKNLMNEAAKGNHTSATSPWLWWLRTLPSSSSDPINARYVNTVGSSANDDLAYNGYFGVSPAICIPANTEVSSEPDSDGAYELFAASTPTVKLYVPHNGITTLPKKIYVGIGGIATPVSKIYTGINGEAVKIYDAGGASGGGIYGAEWDGSSVTTWTRTDDAANFPDPNPYYSGMSGTPSSPFDNIQPWAGMVRVTDSAAGELVAIPKFYYKLEQVGTLGMKIQISSTPQTGFVASPAHMDRGDGIGERDVVYIGRYHCNTSNYKSQTGVKPKASITRATARSSIHNLGATIWQNDFAMRFTLWLLYIVEFANWNSQLKIGYGCGNGTATVNMGYTDSMQYHTGTTQSNRGDYGFCTQYRNIEGLWDNVNDWLDGCYNTSKLNIILNPASFSDSLGGTAIGVPSSGKPSAFTVKDIARSFPMFIPTTSGGSNYTYSCDDWSFSAEAPCLYAGGYYSHGTGQGLFSIGCTPSESSYTYRGCRLMKLP